MWMLIFKINVYLSAFNMQYHVQNINICDAQGRNPLQMAVRLGNAPAVKEFANLGVDVSVVKADLKNAISPER